MVFVLVIMQLITHQYSQWRHKCFACKI